MVNIDKVDKIIQISDIHIRNFFRHAEYMDVFKKMFIQFDEVRTPNTIIFIAGDIAHSKNEISPELIQLISYLFTECAHRCPTFIIPGNHDTNLSNENRLDVLTPIVNALNNSNIVYLKETGLYEFANIIFSHFSVFGKTSKWIPANKIDSEKVKIALYHGVINGAKTELEYTVENDALTVKKFDGFDFVLIGDIHRKQTLQEYSEKNGKVKPAIKYISSLIQQNHGEDLLLHGFEVWDLETKSSEFFRVENDYGFYTHYILNNKPIGETPMLPKYIRLRIFYENCSKEYIQKVISNFKKKHTILDIVTRDQRPASTFGLSGTSLSITNSRDIEYQNSMLKTYFENEDIIDMDLDFIRNYNRELNSRLTAVIDLQRNIQWKPKSFEFSNMFSYGENNIIDFTKLNGINAILAGNASGKTSLLDSLVFCIFDKCTRTFKASNIINNAKTSFNCKFKFEMDDREFTIERIGELNQKTGLVKVAVTFFSNKDMPDEENLTGEDRDDTNKKIREYLGSYDDFLTTTLASQNDPRSIIDMSQRERHELLCKFLDIQIYNDLYQLSKEDTKETLSKIKELEKQNLEEKINEYDSIKCDIELEISKRSEEIDTLKIIIEEKQSTIVSLSENIQNIGEEINVVECKKELASNESELANEIVVIKDLKEKLKKLESSEFNLNMEITKYDSVFLATSNQKYAECKEKLNKYKIDELKLQSEIDKREEKINHLADHKFDPNCKFCIQNKFVIDAENAKIELVDLKADRKELLLNISKQENLVKNMATVVEEYKKYQETQSNLGRIKSNIQIIKNGLESKMYRGKVLQSKMADFTSKINLYYQNENIITKNKKIREQISEIEQTLKGLRQKLDLLLNKLIDLRGKETKILHLIDECNVSQNLLNKLRFESSNYEYYSQAMSKDGIPYLIINDSLPIIENEVNNILGQIVEFTIKLDANEKNNITGNIMYGMEKFWPMEMTSGMEKFILSTAFRVGLMNITTLPCANFMAIDEGFGVLDSDKLNNIYLLFDYLKSKFEFVLCITHIDALKDMVDSTITIEKNAGISRIKY